MTKQFEIQSTINDFKELFNQVYTKEYDVRQYADLLSFFLAGYCKGCSDSAKLILNYEDIEKAILMIEEFNKDARNRGIYAAKCMIYRDYSHPMFNPKEKE